MRKVKFREGVDLANLYGPQDMHLRLIEDGLKVRLSARGDEVTLEGQPDAVGRAENLLCELAERTIGRRQIRSDDVTRALQTSEVEALPISDFLDLGPLFTPKGSVVPLVPVKRI